MVKNKQIKPYLTNLVGALWILSLLIFNSLSYATQQKTLKLSPYLRVTPLDLPTPKIDLATIKPFLDSTVAIEKNQLDQCGYVLSFGEAHVAGSMSDRFYARNLCCDKPGQKFAIFRETEPYIDPETKKLLGYGAAQIGQAILEKSGDPASLVISRSSSEVKVGDRLVPWQEDKLRPYFIPHIPSQNIEGSIIAITADVVTRVEEKQIVVLNRGRNDGVMPGYRFYLYQKGSTILDPIQKRNKKVTLPHKYAGDALVFRVLNNVSFALVMHTDNLLQRGDQFGLPDDDADNG